MKQFRAEEARWQSQSAFLSQASKKTPSPIAPKPKHTNRTATPQSKASILDYVSSLDVLVGTRSLVSHARAVARRPLIPDDQVKKLFSSKASRKELTNELKNISHQLAEQHQALADFSDMQLPLPAAAEWLLDNFFLVQEHIDDVLLSMPGHFFVDLPMINCKYHNVSRPLPRAYLIAAELLSLSSGVVDMETIDRFVVEFQQVTSLKMGELWALPIFLKISLIANIARAAERVVAHVQLIQEADEWCEQIIPKSSHPLDEDLDLLDRPEQEGGHHEDFEQKSEDEKLKLNAKLHSVISQIPTLQSTFLIRVIANLRAARVGPAPLRILDQMLSVEGIDLDALGRQENARVAVNNVLMQHTISSLRTTSSLDWKIFFESNSFTEHVLRTDPIYAQMTFATRDSYRHAVERVASRTKISEEQVAQIAIELARQQANEERHSSHVGYYLIDKGVESLERVCEFKPTLVERIVRHGEDNARLYYFLGQFLLTAFFFAVSSTLFLPNIYWVPILLILCHEMAIEFLHQSVTNLFRPNALPRLDFSNRKGHTSGIPDECKTALVVPLLFGNDSDVQNAVDQLEVQFLANRDKNISFVLLSDFTDSTVAAELPGDAAILEAIKKSMDLVNSRYPEKCFFVFHRPRLLNNTQGDSKGTYMGWERKRGKLTQFNRFLVQGDSEETRAPFNLIYGGDLSRLKGTRYVVTLDADTVLPLEGVRQLVGTAAHPLNVPMIDPDRRIVTRGFGVMQPRLASRLRRNSTRFAWLFSAQPGIDPYVTAVSDVYQDLFGEGSYCGKGIYDVHAFETCLDGRFLENRILSHDLLESAYTRSCLVTDIEVYDDFPSKFIAYAKRKHRWIRGDWQLLRWVFGAGFSSSIAERIGNISILNRWKLFDNMRRTIVEISKFAWFALVLLFCKPGDVHLMSLFGFIVFFLPWVLNLSWSLLRAPSGQSVVKRNYYKMVFADFKKSAQQALVMFSTLPHEVFVSINAILTALVRLVTKRNLLEWTPFSLVEAKSSSDALSIYKQFWFSSLFVVSLLLAIIFRVLSDPWMIFHFAIFFPLVSVWLAAPFIVSRLSMITVDDTGGVVEPGANLRTLKVLPGHADEGRRYALLHWRFFDELMNDSTHWLPPDNIQEVPVHKVAMRTSPTNIAMGLMAIVTAADLGFLAQTEAVARLKKCFDSMKQLRRFRGHFFNWYSLDFPPGQPCLPLGPYYISTVDSGNLSAGLISISVALRQWFNETKPSKPKKVVYEAIGSALKNVLRLCGPSTPTSGSSAIRRRSMSMSSLSPNLQPNTPFDRSIAAIQLVINSLEKPNPNIAKIRNQFGVIREGLGIGRNVKNNDEALFWLNWAFDRLEKLPLYVVPVEADVEEIVNLSDRWVKEMDFSFLVQEDRLLFSIGYDVGNLRLDKSSYDLLASEVRTAVYLAVAQNHCPVESWFRMGRSLVPDSFALISWSGTMFEYLMPCLWLHSYDGTLLGRCLKAAVDAHIAYARTLMEDWHGIALPWGVSESAFNRQSAEGDYQYRAFGVPTIALKRGQERDYVVAPYASMLALHVAPGVAMQNLLLLEHIGGLGSYGFRDAIDYSRPNAYSELAVVHNYMAHHIGMSFASLANYLLDNIWQERFHSNPLVASAELLLHERAPLQLTVARVTAATRGGETQHLAPRIDRSTAVVAASANRDIPHGTISIADVHTPQPRGVLLGSKAYSVYITASGSGYSLCDNRLIYRWRNDSTEDARGMFIYIRTEEKAKKRCFSATYQPTGSLGNSYRAVFSVDSATFERIDGPLQTTTKVAVSTARKAEVRIVKLTNNSPTTPLVVELTSYAEVVLQSPQGDRAHPAFGNLFVDTEWLSADRALVARRRSRSQHDPHVYCVHVLGLSPSMLERCHAHVEYETDRGRFIGRGRNPRAPRAMDWDAHPLGQGSTGSVLDPIFCIRVRFKLMPHETESVAFSTALLPPNISHSDVVNLAGYFSELSAAEHVLEVASSEMVEELRDLALSPASAAFYERLYDEVMFPNRLLGSPEKLSLVRCGQPALWCIGISGDIPIVLLLVETEGGIKTISQILTAHRFWLRKGAKIDIVILNTQAATYQMDLNDNIMSNVYTFTDAAFIDRNTGGGVFVRRKDLIPAHVTDALIAFSRLLIYCDQQEKNSILSTEALNKLTDPTWDPNPANFVPIVADGGDESLDVSIRDRLRNEIERFKTEATTQKEYPASPLLSPLGLGQSRLKSPLLGVVSPRLGVVSPRLAPYSPLLSPGLSRVPYSPLLSGNQEVEDEEPFPPRSKVSARPENLTLWNGFGGVTSEGFYEIHVVGDEVPPAPWCNVISNSSGTGTLISECGGGFTWAWNSGRYRLTPWHNDPVVDPVSEAIYIRDDTTGRYWSPTPRPNTPHHNSRQNAPPKYVVQHQFGKTEFHHEREYIESVYQVGVSSDPTIAAKLSLLRLYNRSKRLRRLSVVGYIEWVCGDQRETTQHHIVTSPVMVASRGVRCVSARRTYDEQLANHLAFFACNGQAAVDPDDPNARTGTILVDTLTCDRRQFIGRNGTLSRPQALEKNAWVEYVGPSFDPCVAAHILVTIEPGQYVDIVFTLGAVENSPNNDKVKDLVDRICHVPVAQEHIDNACEEWNRRLNVIQVKTPHEPTNFLLNRWALYQTLSCRFWARSAFYQSSGAYGFRDQLQDCIAMVYSEPEKVRDHIIKSGGRQFRDGDVLHWWHEMPIHGVRTRISDDLAWLPFVVEHYINVTGDTSIVLNDDVKADCPPYLEMRRPLPPEHDVYDHPRVLEEERGGIYDHCLRALRFACTHGVHDLPLIGCGDWNDGMNQVGPEGKGESVWLGWFLIAVLRRFAETVCRKIRKDEATALEFLGQAERYAVAVNRHAWDGDWFMRGFYDNGNPLGSAHSPVHEANIDSLAQTWSVISGAAEPPERAQQALSSVDKYLVDENIRIIKLLTPPFGSDPNATDNPGYIAGYVPGVRENGAQYTHAATWVVMAHAMLGRGDRAFHLHSMLNPFSHALTQEDAERYRVEPYVVCADVYSAELHTGRGGWTWYTGSSGWMYTVGITSILGLQVLHDGLLINPVIPSKWERFEITYNRYDPKGDKKNPIQVYVIEVLNPHHVMTGVRMIKKCASGFTMSDEDISFTRGRPFIPFTNVMDIESFDNFTLDSSSSPPKSAGSSSGIEMETLHYRVYLGN